MSRPYGDFYNLGPSYEPYNKSYNMDWRNNQDFSWSYNEINTYKQPISPYQPRELPLEEIVNNLAQASQATEENLNKFIQSTYQSCEEEEKEEMEEKAKETANVPFEAPLLYKELKPYVLPITFPSCLQKSKWNK
ncbi:hypothetical protein QYF36_018676 [Acer negundo]|nr:hypothetical protein QYF36_018676 [Acer negundo]